MKNIIKEFFDKRTSTLTYVVSDPSSQDAVVIDSVLDFDPADGRIWGESVQLVLNYVKQNKLNVHLILETHAHADHISGAQYLKKQWPQCKIAIGDKINAVQKIFAPVFNLKSLTPDGSQFDRMLKDGEKFKAGSLEIEVLSTPGHTPACCAYLIGDALFSGDVIFIPDSGTGRCDFPGGSAKDLFNSIANKIYKLPDSTKIYVGHDYQPNGRELRFQTTVAEQKESNIHLKSSTALDEFLAFREARDKVLSAPRLLLPSIQVNINAGRLPEPEDNGMAYIKTPLRMGEI
ncbi:MAG: MBL fold metallo-hydrolase [Bdellovibrionales bacterium]|nr:MBL fold metallo-hydrolase [Bdellovibrionales bacterium]